MPTLNATLKLDTDFTVGDIDPRMFSGFVEHLGRCVYEGIFDPDSPYSDDNGFRLDVIAALKNLKMPLMRYPGGNFVSAYDWRDGIGPREKRPVRPDFAWKSYETNQFGVDEFLDWCELAETAPMMAVNLGTLGATEAAALVEYCNMPHGTYWSDLRAKNGHPAPYDVKTWCLGNEMDGPWQAGHVPADVYAQRAQQAAHLMRGIDNTIETVLCGSSTRGLPTYLHWDRTALEYCWNDVHYLSAHRYSSNGDNDTPAFLADGLETDRILADYAGLLDYVRGVKKSNKHVYLSFDEWNVWYRARGENGDWKIAPNLLEEVYNLEDALVCAQYLMSFLRRADIVKIACLAQVVNVIAPLMTKNDGILYQSIYYPIAAIAQRAIGRSLTPLLTCPTYKAGKRGDAPVLDTAATYNEEDNTLSLFFVNRSQTDAVETTVNLGNVKAISILNAESLHGDDPKAANTWENPDTIKPTEGTATLTETGNITLTIPTLGFIALTVKTEAR